MVFAVLLFGNVTPLIFCCCFSIVNTAITTLAANGASFADNNIDDVVSVLQRNNDIDNSNVSANSFENKKLQNGKHSVSLNRYACICTNYKNCVTLTTTYSLTSNLR